MIFNLTDYVIMYIVWWKAAWTSRSGVENVEFVGTVEIKFAKLLAVVLRSVLVVVD